MPHTRNFLPGAVLLASLLILQGCGKSAEPEAAPAPPTDPMVVTIKPEMASNFEVRPLAMADLSLDDMTTGKKQQHKPSALAAAPKPKTKAISLGYRYPTTLSTRVKIMQKEEPTRPGSRHRRRWENGG